MCPPSIEWLGRARNKQPGQSTMNAHFAQQQVALDQSAGSTIGDTNADEPIDRQADRRNIVDLLKL